MERGIASLEDPLAASESCQLDSALSDMPRSPASDKKNRNEGIKEDVLLFSSIMAKWNEQTRHHL